MYLIRISKIEKTLRKKGYSVTLSYSHEYIYKTYSKCTVAGIKQLEPLLGTPFFPLRSEITITDSITSSLCSFVPTEIENLFEVPYCSTDLRTLPIFRF